jgi:septum formation protein
MRIILASTSPRRREILALLGLPFEVIEPDFEERISADISIEREVLAFAAGKARSVAAHHQASIVIGSDTMIGLDGHKIGKPSDLDDAKRILRALSGKRHRIYTGVSVMDGESGLNLVEQVLVDMRPYTESEIDDYLACGESLDKAGAYSIQGRGAELIAAIRGDYLAAVGLPLRPIADYLMSHSVQYPLDLDQFYANKAFLNWQRF